MYTLNNYSLKDGSKNLFFMIAVMLVFAWCCRVSFAHAEELQIEIPKGKELRGGWYTLDPYQYEKEENNIRILGGLDFELMTIISKEVEERLTYEHVYWDKLIRDLEEGKRDFATGALFSTEREKFAYFSEPYRFEENSLFMRKNTIINAKSLTELLGYIKKNHFRLGVVKGFIYADPLINDYINDPNNQAWIVKTNNEYESLSLLLNSEIDGFLADRIVGSTVIWRKKAGQKLAEHRLNIKRPVHIIFSKKTVSPDIVEKYNKVIERIKSTEGYQKIVSWYLYPIFFLQTEDAAWFKFIEVVGTVAFAISGLVIAFKERSTLLGALILALLPSMGGGLMRDVILGRIPVGALQSPVFLLSILLTVLIGFLIVKLLTHFKRNYELSAEIEKLMLKEAIVILTITDAIGLATFTVTGVIVAMSAKVDPLWLWGPFFAFVTGAGGGVLRDILSKSRYIAALEGELYGEIAIFWGFLLSLFILESAKNAQPEYIQYAVIVTVLGVFFTRLWVHFMHIPNARFKH